MSTSVEILGEDPCVTLAASGDLFMAIWHGAPTVAANEALQKAIRAFGARRRGGIALLVVIEQGCQMPEPSAREAMARDMKSHQGFTRAMALVYEGQGFWAATIRSVVVGILMLSRQSAPAKMFGSIAEAAAWLSHQGYGGAANGDAIEAAVRDARAIGAASRRAAS